VNRLDPDKLFKRIAADIPPDLHRSLFITGSLAAAFHFRAELEGNAVNTKDADAVVHPAGATDSCAKMANRLLEIGWTRTESCSPRDTPDPPDDLRAIRLNPPNSNEYFIEFLNLPDQNQRPNKIWIPVQLADDGWYGLPSFRFMSVTAYYRQASSSGIEYASPAMMALANLLSHPRLGNNKIESGAMYGMLRSAKDLGRVLALATLAGRDKTAGWVKPWCHVLPTCFPADYPTLIHGLASGLEDLLADHEAMNAAHWTTEIGLLNGKNITVGNLRAVGNRLLQDVIEPVQEQLAGR
jgi:hypothetical protein